MEKTAKKSWTTRAFLISLAVLILCSVVNWGVITGWGGVKITRVNLIGDNGLTYSALMYTPKAASNETPLPAILMCHGMSGNARNHESWAVEYSRRGFIVISIDNMGAGDGEYAGKFTMIPDLYMTYLESLPIVDKTRTVVAGHSFGGQMAYSVGTKHNATAIIMANGFNLGMGSQSDETLIDYQGDMLITSSTADKSMTEEVAQDWVNKIFGASFQLDGDAEVGTVYGSFEEGNAHQYLILEDMVHEGVFVTPGHIEMQLDFIQTAFEVPNAIAGSNQVWMWKDVFGLLGMLAFATTLALFALMIIDKVPFFMEIKQPLPRNIGLRGIGLAISIVAALGFPLLCLYTGTFGLVKALGGAYGANVSWLPLRVTNVALAVLIGISCLGVIMLFVFWFTEGRKAKATLRDFGVTSAEDNGINFRLIGKAFLVSAITIAIGWTYLGIQGAVAGTDFYCLFFGYKPIATAKMYAYPPYIIIWILCFCIAAIGMNVERRLPSVGNEKLDTAIAVVFNGVLGTAMISIMVFIETKVQVSLGQTGVALANWGTDITRIWGMPVGMFIGSAGNTFCYRKTGNIWLGVFLFGTICALNAVLYGQIR